MVSIQLLDLPDELLGLIVSQLRNARDTITFGLINKRVWLLVANSPVWRHHCLSTWSSWDIKHEFHNKLSQPPLQTDWRSLYLERVQTDRQAGDLFESLLATQQARASRMNELAILGSDVKDFLIQLWKHTPDDADDVLARRWHAEAILGLRGRHQAVKVWSRLRDGEHIELEDALGAYDEFVLGCAPGVEAMKSSLDAIAAAIREDIPDFDSLTIRQKAVRISEHLRSKGIVGISDADEYHALRNNFISLALTATDENRKGCLPLQSVAIYCAVSRRLGIDARPSNFPRHVHAVVSAPAGISLDGESRTDVVNPESETEMMHVDPFRHNEEVAQEDLLAQLAQIGVPPHRYAEFLGPANELEMVLRTGRNILVSVDGLRMPGDQTPDIEDGEQQPDPDAAKYAALWSLFIQGDSDPVMATTRRRQATRYLLEKLQNDYPQDVDMYAETAPRLLEGLPEHPLVLQLIQRLIASGRDAKIPVTRPDPDADPVQYRVGTYFEHKRYGYRGFIVGWNPNCAATASWITQMRVDDLPRGRDQPFYNIVAADKSSRYVAEENITPLSDLPLQSLLQLAGRFFKRWDEGMGRFVSNIQDEYPHD
ncbi:hypothetical protein N0V93_008450 [Gnomoniopsis smithogilvyi]|uniref:F-box domain-containing protein n=1 Tax=Gnomoniopsis smithogilvyi TaxID=1191159 RepID=A0A9W8YM05_9PEZI|nr:hypothetical protein N0V93_008450 [Gnomoniopsis smithogilvyi]